MTTISKHFDIDYGHCLSLSYPSKCVSVHGHSGRVTLEFSGLPSPETGMVRDYSSFPRALVAELDHKFLVPTRFLEKSPDSEWWVKYGEHRYLILPPEDIYELEGCVNSTAEEIARHLFERLKAEGYDVSRVTFSETAATKAVYPE